MAEWSQLPSTPTSIKVVAGITQIITQIVSNTKTQTVVNTLTHTVANTLTQTVPNTFTHVQTIVNTLTQTISRPTTVVVSSRIPTTITLSGSLTTASITPPSGLNTSVPDNSTDPTPGRSSSRGVLIGVILGLSILGILVGGFLILRGVRREGWGWFVNLRERRQLQRVREEPGIELEERRDRPERMEPRDESQVGRNPRAEIEVARNEGAIGQAL